MTDKELAELREWAIRKASMYERKYMAYHASSALKNVKIYGQIIDLCDIKSSLNLLLYDYYHMADKVQEKVLLLDRVIMCIEQLAGEGK